MNASGERTGSAAVLRSLFIEAFRLGETRFDVWLRHLNAAINNVGGERVFTSNERQLTITHWVMLTTVMSAWMEDNNPLLVTAEALDLSDAAMSLKDLFVLLDGRYTSSTVQKNLIELKRLRLLDQRGRGEKSTIHINMQAIVAVRDTALEWIRAHEELGRNFKRLTS